MGPHLEIFCRLAKLNAANVVDDDACVYLLKEVLRDMKVRGRISDFRNCRVSYGRDGAHVAADLSWDRGWMDSTFDYPRDMMTPEMAAIAEVMVP